MSIISRLGRNLQYGTYLQVLRIVVRFVLMPFILSRVDKGLFGVYVLVNTFIGYFRILDFGVSSSVQKYTAEYNAKGESEKTNDLINFGISFYLIIGVIVSLALLIFSFIYQFIIKVDPSYVLLGRKIFWIASCAAIFIWVLVPFREVIKGLQRSDIISKVGILITLGNLGIAYISLKFYESFILYVMGLQIITILLSLWFIRTTLKMIPEYKFRPFYFSKNIRKDVINYSKYAFLMSLLGIFIFQFDNIVIGVFLSTAVITVYYIAFQLQQQIRSLNALLGSPLVAISSDIGSRDDREKEGKVIFNGTKVMTAIFIPVVIISIIYMKVFILAWMGNEFIGSVLPAQILLTFWFFNNLTEVLSTMVSAGKGRIGLTFKVQCINAIANVVLSIILCKYYGIIGIALGTTIPMIISQIIGIRLYLRFLKVKFIEFFNKAISPNLIHYFFCITLAMLTLKFIPHHNIYTILFEMGMLYAAIAAFYYLVLIDKENKYLVRRILRIRL